jgi:TrmH family RNA methyltransferase
MEIIRSVSSLTNPLVKQLAGLRLRKNRESLGMFLAEGLRTVLEGVHGGAVPRYLVYAADESGQTGIRELRNACRGAEVTCVEVSPHILSKITKKDNPQSVIGVFRSRSRTFAELQPAPSDIFVALDRIRDPGNLGTIIRTADAIAARGIVLIGDCCDPYSFEAVRASMGSIFNVQIFEGSEIEFSELAQTWAGNIIGTSPSAAMTYRELQCTVGAALVVLGNEQSGISETVEAACTDVARIPIYGKPDSLNIGIAAGVILYAVRELRETASACAPPLA